MSGVFTILAMFIGNFLGIVVYRIASHFIGKWYKRYLHNKELNKKLARIKAMNDHCENRHLYCSGKKNSKVGKYGK